MAFLGFAKNAKGIAITEKNSPISTQNKRGALRCLAMTQQTTAENIGRKINAINMAITSFKRKVDLFWQLPG
jgi:hypothetical protein